MKKMAESSGGLRKKNIAIATFGRYKKQTPCKNTGFVISMSPAKSWAVI
ncbi:TPA: hypothetical protein KL738_004536 [Escherichia coli]|nr:hypothetical protein [Escherichia coli]